MSVSLKILKPSEAYDHGWQIVDDLAELTQKKYDEDWESPDRAETVRRIARSQDDTSLYRTRQYLKSRLVGRRPQRRFSSQVEPTIDRVLASFYFGDPQMSSIKQLKADEQLRFEREQRRSRILEEMRLEIQGLTAAQLPGFITDVLRGKYYAELGDQDWRMVIAELTEGFAPVLRQIPAPEAVKPSSITTRRELFTSRLFRVIAIEGNKNPLIEVEVLATKNKYVFSLEGNELHPISPDPVTVLTTFKATFDQPEHFTRFEEKVTELLKV